VIMVGLAWMQMALDRSLPVLVNLCGVFGWGDDDVAWSGADLLVSELEGERAFLDDPGFVVGLAVEAWSLAGVAVVEDERDRCSVVSRRGQCKRPQRGVALRGERAALWSF
jgi:hypothetical protein